MSLFNYDNISWNLPLLFCHDELIFALGDVFSTFKNIKIPKLYAYGSITSPWAGGRKTFISLIDSDYLEEHLNKVLSSGFIPNFTFTKPYIKKDDLNDKISNWILDYGIEHGCEFLVASDLLYNYIKDKYPQAKISASILQGKMKFHNPKKRFDMNYELNFYNEKMDKYERVVARPEFIIEALEKNIDKIRDVSKIEVHINETCIPNCENSLPCYLSMDRYLSNENYDKEYVCSRDLFFMRHSLKENFSYSLMMKKDFINNLVNNLGIKHLKIQGRHYESFYLFNLVLYYLFECTGNFQTIYPYIMEKCKEYKLDMTSFPFEQKIVIDQELSHKKIIKI